MKKPKPKQLEVNWGNAEPFALTIQQTTDGDRIARQAEQKLKDIAVSESKQTEIRTRA